MQLAGYFVEYLIVGSVTLAWALPLFERLGVTLPSSPLEIAVLAPSIYVLGMVVDAAGHFLTLFHRRKIRRSAKDKYTKRYGLSDTVHATVDAELFAAAPDLAKAAAARVSRARIARGAVTNAVLGLICWFPFLALSGADVWFITLVTIGTLIAIGVLWSIWARWQRLSYRFEHHSAAEIRRLAGQ